MGLIVANVFATVVGTVDVVSSRFGPALRGFQLFSVAVFTVEYLARLWAAVEFDRYESALFGRIRYASRPLLIVDLLAILPFYVTLGIGTDLRFLRALRLIRVLRVVKIARYSESLRRFSIVFRNKKPDLAIALFGNSLLLVVASSLMYVVESAIQPENFSSIPQAMWWGVITLTTVGYGDVYPITPLGKFLGAIVALLGVGFFALPSSILASGFIQESARKQTEKAAAHSGRDYCPHCGEQLADSGD